MQANWNIFDTAVMARRNCFNTLIYFYGTHSTTARITIELILVILVIAVINIMVDIWILALPIKTLIGIKRSRREKMILFIIFGIGGVACISRCYI